MDGNQQNLQIIDMFFLQPDPHPYHPTKPNVKIVLFG